MVTTGRLGDISKVGGSRLVGRLGRTVDGSLGSLGSLDGRVAWMAGRVERWSA